MKFFIKSSIFTLLLLVLGGCENDNDTVAVANGLLLKPLATGDTYVLIPQNNDDKIVLEWDKANNGVPSVSTYNIELARSGTNFANPIDGVKSTDAAPKLTYTWTVSDLNQLLLANGFNSCESASVDIRVKSTLGGQTNPLIQYSNVLTITVTPYSNDLPLIAISTDAQNLAQKPKIAAGGVLNKEYEGYMWFEPGVYKLYQPTTCGSYESPVVYGDSGDGVFDTLEIGGDGYEITTAGFYLVKANLQTLKYSIRSIKWNFYGTAKQTFPATNVAMTYNATEKVWQSNVANPVRLAEGYGLKFRSDAGSVLGIYNASGNNTALFGGSILTYLATPLPVEGGPQALPYVFEVSVPGPKVPIRVIKSYVVKLDLNSPRNYKFSITEVPAI